MKPCPKMQAVIIQLAQKHEVDIGVVGARMQLELLGFDRLCVERVGQTRIAVAHYFETQGHLVPEPDVTFYVDPTNRWIPIDITQSMTGWQQYAELNDDCTEIIDYNRTRQPGLADFCEQWAQNLHVQDWLENAKMHQLSGNYLFALGQIVATPGVLEALAQTGQTPDEFITRHVQADWGDLDEHDLQENNAALARGGRLFSAYTLQDETKIWLITEWDRSVTTLLLPSEY